MLMLLVGSAGPSVIVSWPTKKFVERSLMLGCERYASAVVVENAQEASQVDKVSPSLFP
jgi:hypothetical protein